MTRRTIKARIAQDASERRRAPRHAVELDGGMRELGSNMVDAQVTDISEIGFQACSDTHFEVGSRVWLILPGRDRANAVVVWVSGDRLGAEFAEPISLEGLID